MNWKDELRKMPFQVKPVVLEAQGRATRTLELLLEKTLDQRLKNHINKFPQQNRFTLPMDIRMHKKLVNLAGGEDELVDMIKALYELGSFHIKPGAIPGHTEGAMAYHFELL